MKRRSFLLVGLLIVSSFALLFLVAIDFNELIKRVILQDTAKLKVNNETVDRFVADALLKKKWDQFDSYKKLFITLHFQLDNSLFVLPYANKYKQYRSFIVRNFLLSTDFFLTKMDENITLKYIGLHNPYQRPCSNPFSNLYYDANAYLNGQR